MEVLVGLIVMIAGAFFPYWGYKEHDEAMGGWKYRKIVMGIGLIFFGLIIIFR